LVGPEACIDPILKVPARSITPNATQIRRFPKYVDFACAAASLCINSVYQFDKYVKNRYRIPARIRDRNAVQPMPPEIQDSSRGPNFAPQKYTKPAARLSGSIL
jgi:hypothetical protein